MGYLIAGNWKMNGTPATATALTRGIGARVSAAKGKLPEIVLCPPSPLLLLVGMVLDESPIALGAQDCHAAEKGAHTGDTSAWLLKELACKYVIVGHSERRADHGETDTKVKAKASAAVKAGLIPIICVGETDAQRERGETTAVIARQVENSIPDGATAKKVVVAYEPVWAIGTGKTATSADIAAVHDQIRRLFTARHDDNTALRILYGGSVKGANAVSILATKGVDGALVGGASLDLDDFWQIIQACPKA